MQATEERKRKQGPDMHQTSILRFMPRTAGPKRAKCSGPGSDGAAGGKPCADAAPPPGGCDGGGAEPPHLGSENQAPAQ